MKVLLFPKPQVTFGPASYFLILLFNALKAWIIWNLKIQLFSFTTCMEEKVDNLTASH